MTKITYLIPERAALAEIGRRLRQIRTQRGLSRAELAAEAGISPATIVRMERGASAQMSSWIRILTALRMSDAIDNLLPEHYASPMAEAKAAGLITSRRKRTRKWVDEL